MKTLLFAAALLAAPAMAATHTYTNPILYADYSDPDVIRVGKDYYLVASSFHFSPGLPVLKSSDLVHWRIVGHVLPRLDFSPSYDMVPPFTLTDAVSKPVGKGLRYAGGVWAPAIRHHNGLFYVYWPTPDEGVFMATAKTPEGPWSRPVPVLAGLGYEDPCPFWDDDGQAYLVHGKVGAGPLILHRMSADGTKVLDSGKVIAEDKVNLPVLEGPKLYKRNGWYYIFAPIGGVDKGGQAVGRARNIYGPYEWKTVLEKGSTSVQGPHQGGYVETPSGQGWFIHFNSTGAFGRIDYLEPVRWQDDWPVMGDDGQPVLSHAAPDTRAWTNDRLKDSDEFSSAKLGLQWEWNHNPDNAKWSLKARKGYLRLTAGPAEQLVQARNTLTQILQGPSSTVTAKLDLSHMADGQRAGLVLFGVKPVWLGAVRDGGKTHLTFASAGVETPGPEISGTIQIRAEVAADQTVRFSYSQDGKAFTPFGDALPLARFSWWKGSRPGLFTYIKAANGTDVPNGYVDIDWVHVETGK
ncbi:glycoside hydrolase family 43 protein [Asticcacaulis solisilvae]|uniref:glycoside hydrolase family 43 protein n=1 Tax=Asticcacaulis solisilvae TaxID=1217274 RepID=UPI003FD85092